MIKSVTDVVYSEQEFGGIELNSELPNLSDDYEPPELEQLLQDSQGLEQSWSSTKLFIRILDT